MGSARAQQIAASLEKREKRSQENATIARFASLDGLRKEYRESRFFSFALSLML